MPSRCRGSRGRRSKRTLEYVKSLPTATEQYDIFGVTPGFGIPEAPAEGGAGGAVAAAAGGAGGQGG